MLVKLVEDTLCTSLVGVGTNDVDALIVEFDVACGWLELDSRVLTGNLNLSAVVYCCGSGALNMKSGMLQHVVLKWPDLCDFGAGSPLLQHHELASRHFQ